MVTGCAPFFLLALAGVALGSWLFGSHAAARFMGLGALLLFLLYFALLNWTAQSHLRLRPPKQEEAPSAPQKAMDGEARAEWTHYLRTEGRMLWLGVGLLLATILLLILKGR